MFSRRVCLLLIGLVVLKNVTSSKHRYTRSPDKVEVVIPNYTVNQPDVPINQGNINEEAAHWHGEGEKYEEMGNSQLNQAVENGEKHKEQIEQHIDEEQQHQQAQQETFHKDAEQAYHNNKETAETYQETNLDHYQGYNDTSNLNEIDEADEHTQNAVDEGERYGDKGTEYVKDKGDNIGNINYEGFQTPSYSYT